MPPTGSNFGGNFVRSTKRPKTPVHPGTPPPEFELYSPEPSSDPRIQFAKRLWGLCQSEVRLPTRQIYPELLRDLKHATTTIASGETPNALLERVECFGGHSYFDRIA